MRELTENEVKDVSGGNKLLQWTAQAVAGGALWDGIKAAGRYMTRPNEADVPAVPPPEAPSNPVTLRNGDVAI